MEMVDAIVSTIFSLNFNTSSDYKLMAFYST